MSYYIGEFARLTGLGIHTLRFYEREGLIRPCRDAGGRRIYTEEDLAWIEFVQRLKETGMPLREIRRYAELRAEGQGTLADRLSMLEEHGRELDVQIVRMQENRRRLDEKICWYRKQVADRTPG